MAGALAARASAPVLVVRAWKAGDDSGVKGWKAVAQRGADRKVVDPGVREAVRKANVVRTVVGLRSVLHVKVARARNVPQAVRRENVGQRENAALTGIVQKMPGMDAVQCVISRTSYSPSSIRTKTARSARKKLPPA